ncbi:cellulose biosynthesis protein BcsC [Zavarzinia compransoris]|uniref:Cellulose synthase operon C C-terminal domain-containing protein n=1 Tax=Zavarzinia compransoris TaxID=1264899 RepID=A0A317E1H3_9PROT|nr:cellulose biosynthesis protein BcsC [Zavarzinia compransoris]PWR20491.1 hypothetical protein DKG75_10815 [Zavarzinia compransoris]TDP43863.1 Tfp pilus assembly protein PilF [Zavarzinia compransoris]
MRHADWRSPVSRAALAAVLGTFGLSAAEAQQAPAGGPAPQAVAGQGATGVHALLEQAVFWHERGRTDLAAQSMQRAYAIAPNDPDVIFRLGLFAVQDGKTATAEAWLQQLRRVTAPGDQRLARLEQAARQGAIPADGIAAARALAQAGRTAEAVATYRRLFGAAPPPDSYALEYYQTLAGQPESLNEALAGLAQLAQRDPMGPAAVAYGKALTYNEQSRRQGIALLAARGAEPDARAAWRQALLWLGATAADKPLYDAYLAAYPDDQAVLARFREGTQPQARTDGFAALDGGDSRLAEQRFRQRLQERPDDAEALGGLGILRLRAGDHAGARDYLERATRADPARRGQWAEALASARFLGEMAAARRARDAGRLQEAETKARALAGGAGQRGRDARLLLADILVRRGQAAAAEAEYRAVLAAEPANGPALSGLYELLVRQRRTGEAEALAARLPPGRTRSLEGLHRAESDALRARAKDSLAAGDVLSARADLETALAGDPNNAWLRLDLARLLAGQGEGERARALIDGMTAPANAGAEALHAGALFAGEQGRYDVAAALIERIPARARTPEMRALSTRSATEAAVGRARTALAGGDAAGAQGILRGLYASAASLSIAERGTIAAALVDAGDPALALSLVRQDLEAVPKPPAARYAGHLNILAGLGMDAEAQSFLARLAQVRGVDGGELAGLGARFASGRGDRLREAGQYADAYDVLALALAQSPGDIGLINALGRLYDSGGMPDQALAAFRRALALDPGNREATRGAIGAAIAAGDTETADRLLRSALAGAPGDVDLHVMAANLARARGDTRAAVEALETAQSLRAQQLGTAAALPPAAATTLPGRTVPAGVPGNPFRRSSTGGAPAISTALPETARPYAEALPVPHDMVPHDMAPRDMAMLSAASGETAGDIYLPGGRPLEILPRAYDAPTVITPRTETLQPPATVTPARPIPIPPAPVLTMPPTPVPTAPTLVTPTLTAPAPAPAAPAPVRYPSPSRPRPALPVGPAVADSSLLVPALPSAALAGDPMSQEIARQLAELKDQAAGFVRGDISIRNRSGDEGLSALTEVGANVGVSVSPLGTGRLTVTANPVNVNAGTPSGDASRRFGANPLIPTTVTSSNYQELAAIVRENDGVWSLLTPAQRTILGAAVTTPTPTLLAEFVTANPALVAGLPTEIRTNIQAAATGTLLSAFVGANPTIWNGLTAAQQSLLGAALASDTYSFDTTRMAALRRSPKQETSGVGLSAAYELGSFKADVGTTPLGFEVTNLVGGVTWRPRLGNDTELSVTGERRAVTDSMLSYAGTVEPFSGQSWGGVTRTGGRVMLSTDDGAVGLYGGGGYYRLEGENVADNSQIEATVGAYFRPYRTERSELKAGINLSYMAFDENLGEFSFGHGGYFSPQTFYSVAFPVEYTGTSESGKWKYNVGGAVGYQSYDKDAAPYFPTDPEMQAILDRESASGLIATSFYPASSANGFGASLKGSVDYSFDRLTTVGAAASYNGFGDYSETSALIYMKRALELEP